MMGNLYKNQNLKFSMWAKRLVWDGPDANTAIEGAITEAQKSQEQKTADQIMKNAERKLGEKPENTATQEQKDAYDKALLAVRAAKDKYEKVAKDLATRLALTERLEKVNPEADFLHAVDETRDIKAKNGALPQEMRIEVSDVEAEISNAAIDYYNGKRDVAWFAEGDVKGDYEVSTGNYRLLMGNISEMQEAIMAGLPGLNDGEKETMSAAYKQRIDAGLKWLQAHKDENFTTDGGASAPLINSDEKPALDRLAFAVTNLTAAEKSGQEGHEAGAKQYMSMVLAEQEARRAWTSFEYGTSEIVVRSDDGESNPVLKVHYNAGVTAFNEALLLSGRTNDPKYKEAAGKFKEAARLFRLVKETEDTLNTAKEKEPDQKQTYDTLTSTMQKVKTLQDRLVVTDVGVTQGFKGLQAKIKLINLGADLDPQTNYLASPFTELAGYLTSLETMETEYNNLKSNILPGRMASAIEHIKGQYKTGNRAVNVQEVVNNFVGVDKLGLTAFQKEVLTNANGMVLRGAYEAMDSRRINKKYAVVAINKGGQWEVTKNVQTRANDEVKLISRQDALNFAKGKARAAFFQQDNPDKAEAIEDYILDMSEWSPDLGGASKAEEVYLQMLEGEEFDVQNSDFHVKIAGGDVIVTRRPSSVPGGSGGSGGAGGTGEDRLISGRGGRPTHV